ncbi:fibronectin type 3 and ankyrin repeat domains 1 protein-like [Amphiura filiformis]|uniref:fibronectin type 3 and ankyrin repeat domains 1 protein-like n=1 Tax=Amphiura filiformis TaxID=82378 RepID=UPI003B20E953
MSAPDKPDPPVVGKVTHHSIELYWDNASQQQTGGSRSSIKGDNRLRYMVEESDKVHGWGNVYTGFATNHVFDGLDTSTQYKYRLKVSNDHGNSEFSRIVTVSTTKEPMTGEHLHKAVGLLEDLQRAASILEDDHVWVDVPDKMGASPLMVASQKGNNDMIDLLVRHGADVHACNSAGKDSLMLACFAGHLEVVKKLRSCGASWEKRDRGGSTALHWAVDGGNTELIKWMIQDGAKVDERDTGSKWTPLMRCAAVVGKADVAKVLLNAGADCDAKDKDGKTPLMVASLNGHHHLVRVLVERGADPNVKNEFGMSAKEMAVSFDRRKVLKYFDQLVPKTRSAHGPRTRPDAL